MYPLVPSVYLHCIVLQHLVSFTVIYNLGIGGKLTIPATLSLSIHLQPVRSLQAPPLRSPKGTSLRLPQAPSLQSPQAPALLVLRPIHQLPLLLELPTHLLLRLVLVWLAPQVSLPCSYDYTLESVVESVVKTDRVGAF